MNVAKILTAASLTMVLAACTAGNPTGTNDQNNTSTEVKKTLSGTITKGKATYPKLAVFTVDAADDAEATTLLLDKVSQETETLIWTAATAVAPGADGAYSFEMKLGTKALTAAVVYAWDDANNDGKRQKTEQVFGNTSTDKLQFEYRLTKTDFKEYKEGAPAEAAAKYDWKFAAE